MRYAFFEIFGLQTQDQLMVRGDRGLGKCLELSFVDLPFYDSQRAWGNRRAQFRGIGQDTLHQVLFRENPVYKTNTQRLPRIHPPSGVKHIEGVRKPYDAGEYPTDSVFGNKSPPGKEVEKIAFSEAKRRSE